MAAAWTSTGSGMGVSTIVALAALAVLGIVLLLAGRRDYPDLHTMLDTGIFLLSCTLALLLWDMGTRLDRALLRWLAVSFAITSLLEFVHVAISVEWSGELAAIARARDVLRPITWAVPAYVLPVGVGVCILLA